MRVAGDGVRAVSARLFSMLSGDVATCDPVGESACKQRACATNKKKFLDLLGGATKPGLVPAWRHPNAPRPRRDEPRPDPLDHVERNHGEDDETGRIRHRPVSPSERLLSTELVPIMPLYAVATGPIIADQLSS